MMSEILWATEEEAAEEFQRTTYEPSESISDFIIVNGEDWVNREDTEATDEPGVRRDKHGQLWYSSTWLDS